MRRATSTRRKNSNANTVGPTRTPPKSTSNHSHLAVKNGAALPATEKDNEAITVGMVGVAGSISGSGTVPETITNAEVVVTETETLLPKKAWLYTLG